MLYTHIRGTRPFRSPLAHNNHLLSTSRITFSFSPSANARCPLSDGILCVSVRTSLELRCAICYFTNLSGFFVGWFLVVLVVVGRGKDVDAARL